MASAAGTLRSQFRGLLAAGRAIRLFRRELLKHRRGLAIAAACSVGYSVVRLLEPWPLALVFDNVLAGRPLRIPLPGPIEDFLTGDRMRILALVAGAIVLLAFARSMLYYHQRTRTAEVGQAVVLRLRQRLFAHLQRLSLSFHTGARSGELLTRLTSDVNMLRELLVATLLSMLSEGTILIAFGLAMFLVDRRLALIAVLVIPVVFALTTIYSGRIRSATRKQRRREGELAARLNEALSGIHVVQLFTREDDEEERLRALNKRSLRSGVKATRLEAQLNRSVEIAVAAATAAVLWFGARQVIAGRMTPGELLVFIAYLQGCYRPLRRISRVAQRAAKASICVERVTGVLAQEPEVRDGKTRVRDVRGRITFENVSFGYSASAPVLRGVDLVIEPGETVAVVGRTGAGKSTLLALVPRLYDPTSGTVRIDGWDMRDLTLHSLRSHITIVPQDGFLFGSDFRENIAYGAPRASAWDVEEAARAAHIHEFIRSQRRGYETRVGERGVTLSGGQKQRLAIARAFLRDAPIVLLDEPLAGLDAESEVLVLDALDRLLVGRTAIIVTHDLALARRADVVVVLEGGTIVEQGPHPALLEHGERYRRLWQLQRLDETAA